MPHLAAAEERFSLEGDSRLAESSADVCITENLEVIIVRVCSPSPTCGILPLISRFRKIDLLLYKQTGWQCNPAPNSSLSTRGPGRVQ